MSRNKHYKGKAPKPVKLSSRKTTEEEKEYYEKLYAGEKEKYERDKKCGGISEDGHYVRLHDRYDVR